MPSLSIPPNNPIQSDTRPVSQYKVSPHADLSGGDILLLLWSLPHPPFECLLPHVEVSLLCKTLRRRCDKIWCDKISPVTESPSRTMNVRGWSRASPNTNYYCTPDITVMGLFIGVPRRWSVRPVNCIYTHSSHTCCSLMSVENRPKWNTRITILEYKNNYIGSKQNMTDMDTKRARGECVANALVCKLCWISC